MTINKKLIISKQIIMLTMIHLIDNVVLVIRYVSKLFMYFVGTR